jgi:hypothetical protein
MAINRDEDRLPDTTFAAVYPNNLVSVSPGGHEEHIDDTDGAKRYRRAHPSGTYTEISDDGKKVEVVIGNSHYYNKGGVTFTVQENGDIQINGHARFSVGAGSHMEVGGDATVAVGGDCVIHAVGNLKAGAADVYIGSRGNMDLNCSGNFNLLVGGTANMESDGNMTLKAPRIDLNK